MKKSDAIAYYATQAGVAAALGIRQNSVAEWGEYPPDNRQLQMERLTKGRLKAEPGCMDRLLGMSKAKPVEKAGA